MSITELPIPTVGGDPLGITKGPDGNLWFAAGINRIGMINPTTHQISDFTTPTPGSRPEEIVAGPDGNLWFTESGVGKVAEIDPTTKQITEFPLPSALAQPLGIAVGPDQNIWFTESGQANHKSQVGMINPTTKQITEFATPTPNSSPTGITSGPGGKLWFTEPGYTTPTSRIASIDPTTGAITEYPVSSGGNPTGPVQITTDNNGHLWFTEQSNQVGGYDPAAHIFTQVTLADSTTTANRNPDGIVTGPDGNLWFTESGSDQVGVLNPTTLAVTQLSAPRGAGSDPSEQGPADITVGPDGNLWVTVGSITETVGIGGDTGAKGIGTINPTTKAEAFYSYPSALSPEPDAITTGPDGHLWFTDDAGRVGELDPATGVITEVPFNPDTTPFSSAITRGPDGAVWFTAGLFAGKEQVDRIDPSTMQITRFTVGEHTGLGLATTVPLGITAGPDGNIWFAMEDGQIGEIDLVTQAVQFYQVPNSDPVHNTPLPFAITAGPDGGLWFIDQDHIGTPKIGMINPVTKAITEYPLPDPSATPWDITAGPDGNLWFTERDADKIASFSPTTHQVAAYPVPSASAFPTGITAGPDGRIWFSESSGNKIASIDTTTHQITEYHTPTSYPYSDVQGITAGPDGKVYFAEQKLGAIGVANLSAELAPAPELTAASDTGVSQTDGITRNNGSAAAPLVFTIPSADSNLDYRLYDVTNPDNPVLLAGPVTTSDGTVSVSGTALTDGVHRIAYTSATGTTGTESALSASVSITVQTSLTITRTNPDDGAVVSALPDGSVTITFSHPLAGLSPGGTALLPSDPFDVVLIPRGPDGTFSAPTALNSGDLPVSVHTLYRTTSDGGSIITLTPTEPLSSDVFLIALNRSDFADLAGNALTDARGGYRTFLLQPPAANTDPLRVVAVTSNDGADVINNNLTVQPDTIAIQFNKPLFAGAAGGDNVQLIANPGPNFSIVPALAAYSPSTNSIDLTPEALLNPGTVYAVAVHGALSDDQGFGGPGHPLGQTFYDTFTVSNGPVTSETSPLKVVGAPGSPQIVPQAGTTWFGPVGYVSVPFTEPLDIHSLGAYSAMLIPRAGGTQGNQFDAADLPLNATVAFNPNTNQLIIVPSQPVGNDVYLLALGAINALNGDPLLNDAGQPAGVSGNPPYYATFQVIVVHPSTASAVAAHPTIPGAGGVETPAVASPAPVTSLTRPDAQSSSGLAVPAGPLRTRPAQAAVSIRPGGWCARP